MTRTFNYKRSNGDVVRYTVADFNLEALYSADRLALSLVKDFYATEEASKAWQELYDSLELPTGTSKKNITPQTHFYALVVEKTVLESSQEQLKRKEKVQSVKERMRASLQSSKIRLFKHKNIIND